MIFRRSALTREMAQQLLKSSCLKSSLRSGLFLSGQRRVGKTTFLATDLIPALVDEGTIVINVDLWSQPQALGAAAADVELQKTEALGPLAEAVFSRICRIGGNVKGGFTAEALKE